MISINVRCCCFLPFLIPRYITGPLKDFRLKAISSSHNDIVIPSNKRYRYPGTIPPSPFKAVPLSQNDIVMAVSLSHNDIALRPFQRYRYPKTISSWRYRYPETISYITSYLSAKVPKRYIYLKIIPPPKGWFLLWNLLQNLQPQWGCATSSLSLVQ